MPLIPALGRQRQADSEFEASLVYRVSSRKARAIQRNPVSKNQKKKRMGIRCERGSWRGLGDRVEIGVCVHLWDELENWYRKALRSLSG
jgi:hypothetical protein